MTYTHNDAQAKIYRDLFRAVPSAFWLEGWMEEVAAPPPDPLANALAGGMPVNSGSLQMMLNAQGLANMYRCGAQQSSVSPYRFF